MGCSNLCRLHWRTREQTVIQWAGLQVHFAGSARVVYKSLMLWLALIALTVDKFQAKQR